MMYCLKKRSFNKNCKFINLILQRYASSGLNLWDLNIDNSIRHRIEKYWEERIFHERHRDDDDDMKNKEKFYVLSMFPYPSGSLHMGHVRVYAISDAIARFHRMQNQYVIHPMGWDSFGLPAENAALERKIDAGKWTDHNIANMKEQLKKLGCDFDWDRELSTCKPEYFRWTQELFLKLFKRGLAYQKQAAVNWDPVDQTVLAEEQVDHNGKSWRSGAKVEQKLLKQWFIRTTKFAAELYNGLDDPMLKDWRDVKKIQRHWLGECTGTSIDFKIVSDLPNHPEIMTLWTDTPESIEHAKFVAVSKANFLTKSQEDECRDCDSKLLSAKAINPFNNEELPIYFTKTIKFNRLRDDHLGIPCEKTTDAEFCDSVGISYEKIEELSDDQRKQKRLAIMEDAQKRQIGGYSVSITLRDWLISRQRYWGTPIPIIHCQQCGARPVPEKDLPVLLPNCFNTDSGEIPNLRQAVDWLKTSCPDCGADAVRDADTMDTFVDSSWYFIRYLDNENSTEMFSKDKVEKFLPVDLYIGGKEHACLHLYYARFINHFLHSEGLVPTKEPFKQLLVQGMVNGMSYRVKGTGKYLKKHEVVQGDKICIEKATGDVVIAAWEKMSKSKYNGVDPVELFTEYGADTTRLLMLADVAPISPRNWSTQTFPGVLNWQQRLWLSIRYFLNKRKTSSNLEKLEPEMQKQLQEDDDYLFDSRNYYIKGVTFNITTTQQLSVAISKMLGLTNSLRRVSTKCLTHSPQYERALAAQIIMLAPIAPRFASELWAGFCSASYHLVNDKSLQREKDVLEQTWPTVDMNYNLDLDVFVNANEVKSIKIPRRILDDLSTEAAAQIALNDEEVQRIMIGKEIINYRLNKIPNCDSRIYFKTISRTTDLRVKELV